MTGSSATIAARLDRLLKCRYIRDLVLLISLGGCFEFGVARIDPTSRTLAQDARIDLSH